MASEGFLGCPSEARPSRAREICPRGFDGDPLEDQIVPSYFIRTADGTRGPMPGKAVIALIEAGKLEPNDLVRLDGDRNWHPVSSVKGLRDRDASPQVGSDASSIETGDIARDGFAARAEVLPTAPETDSRTRYEARPRRGMGVVWLAVSALLFAGMLAAGWSFYRSSAYGLQHDANELTQCILDGEPGTGPRARPYLDRLEKAARRINETRIAEDVSGFLDAVIAFRDVCESAGGMMLERVQAGQATSDHIRALLKVLQENPAVRLVSFGDKKWEQRLVDEQPKRMESLMAAAKSGSPGMDGLRDILRKEQDAKFERERLAREAELERSIAKSRREAEEMNARFEAERLERKAKSYNLKGTFTVAAQESGKVSFGREFLVPPEVKIWPATQSGILVHEAFYSQATIITEVTTTGFAWRCTLDLTDDAIRMNVPFNYCNLQWDATGSIRVSDLTPYERMP